MVFFRAFVSKLYLCNNSNMERARSLIAPMQLSKFTPSRILHAVQKRTGNSASGRKLTVQDSDVYITSYPKSGNTWVRFIIANMLHPDGTTDFKNINKRVPDIYTLSDRNLLAVSQPRYLKSHEYFDPRYQKVLYVVRDVRSVIISYYHHLTLTGRLTPGDDMADFAESLLNGTVNRYGSWQDNVLSWMKVRGNDSENFRLIRYEDLKDDSFTTCQQISQFLSLNLSDEVISKVIELSAFERMSELEKAGIDQRMVKGASKPVLSGFVRSGKTKEWQEEFPQKTKETINRKCGALLEELGYTV